jgi:hypothetical protein
VSAAPNIIDLIATELAAQKKPRSKSLIRNVLGILFTAGTLRGKDGDPGPPGPPGTVEDTFESIVSNLKSYPVTATTKTSDQITKTFDVGGGQTIIVTINFVAGLPTTKVLSGTGLPSGIATTCTYDWTGREIPLKTYS